MEEPLQEVLDHDDRQKSSPAVGCRSIVDTSRPFRSVKEAVAIFGERFLAGEIYSFPKPVSLDLKKETPTFLSSPAEKEYMSPGHEMNTLSDSVKKLEAELEHTKAELKLLKERESETEAALASLNAELHKNMSKLAAASSGGGDHGGGAMMIVRDQVELAERKRDAYLRIESERPKLAQILSIGEKEGWFVGRKKEMRKVMKKKPIIPLVGDLFSRKKLGPLYAYSPHLWN